MATPNKRLFLGFLAVIVAILISASLIARSIDLSPYISKIESAALEAGIPLRIDGDIHLSLIPSPGIEVDEVYIQLGHKSRVSIDELHVHFSIWPLFDRELRITNIQLNKPSANLAQLSFSLPKSRASESATAQDSKSFNVTVARDAKVVISNGELKFKKIGSPRHIVVKDLAIRTTFRSSKTSESESLRINELRPSGRLSASMIKGKYAAVENVRAKINLERGRLDITDISGTVFGGRFSAVVGLNNLTPPLSGDVSLKLEDIDVAKSTINRTKSQLVDGKLALDSRIKWKGTKIPEIIRSMTGEIGMTGENLRLRAIDIDKALERIENTKRLNLTDLGALFYLGPLGAVATKGYQYSELLKTRDAQPGTIDHLISKWKIGDGRATVTDVALTTPNNRIAIKGSVNLVDEKFENLAFSVVDEKGCGIMAQQINGPFNNPKPSAVRSIRSVGRPFLDALREPIKRLTGTDCTVFYTGSLKHPEADKLPQQKSLISDTLQSIGISSGDN